MNANLATLAVASNNAGKIAELRSLLGPDIRIVTLAELGLPSPEETEGTFIGNAALKAQYVFARTGLVALADDSGLEVDALGGRPGVHSARFAGDDATDADNRTRLLAELREVPAADRNARFVCAIAVVDVHGRLHTATGTCGGSIGFEELGDNGFGYDSLFVFPDGRTMAQLEPDEKNVRSHRGHALRSALPKLMAALAMNATRDAP